MPAGHTLTARELDVLQILVQGRTDKEIAAALRIRPRTVSNYVSAILLKLDSASRTEAATVAIARGLVSGDPADPGAAP